jgi:aminoglycoside phosphotransferase (APT) family kinase protein
VSIDTDADRLASLTGFLHRQVFPDAATVELVDLMRPTGGASWETFICTLRVGSLDDHELCRVVLKRAPVTGPLAPYDVVKDVTIFEALAGSDVPAPRLLAWSDDPEVFERPFTVTAFVDGESDDITKVERWPVWQSRRQELGNEIVDKLAALQRFDWHGTRLPEVLGERGSAARRAASIVDRYLVPLLTAAEEQGMRQPLWREIGEWIKDNAPDIDEADLVVVHGDYRFGNFLWQGTSIAAIIDWERAMLGPPMQELGFLCMPLSRRRDPSLMAKALTLPQLVERYEAATGTAVEVAQVMYYAVIWQWIEGVNATRGMLAPVGHGLVGSSGLIQPNLVARQTLALIDDYDAGRFTL